MKKIVPALLLLAVVACKQAPESSTDQPANLARHDSLFDPHSYARPDSAVVKHLDLELTVDFDKHQLNGKASWDISNINKGNEIIFDANTLYIEKVTLGPKEDEKETTYFLDSAKPFMGQALHVKILPNTTKLSIYYSTSNEAMALQWLSPPQTAGKQSPFLFTQSQPILARSWIPCQDGPGIRFTYNATVTVPKGLMAVMSAENAQQKNADGIYFFKQTHPIPSYLLALAVGDIAFRSIDNRTGVYAEPSVVDKAAWEFADMGKMMTAAEKLYGAYRWGRYDVIVLPPGFPFGGMENPNLTFVTPSLLAGDRSLVSVIAHELAHSWSGNLVTNASWNDMWLNEGFTTYFERRIVESIYGKKEMQMQEVLGRQSLAEALKEVGDTSRDSKLKTDLEGRDPDAGISQVPYEKGYAFLRVIEEAAGRQKFDSFLNNYFNKNAFQSRTTEQFLAELNSKLIAGDSQLVAKIKANDWIYKPGIPANIVPAVSSDFVAIDSLIANWKNTGTTIGFGNLIRSTNQKLYFISHIPADINAAWMSKPGLAGAKDSLLNMQAPLYTIDSLLHFTQSGNAEIQSAWYTLAVNKQYKPAYPAIETFLMNNGRRKLIVPVYKAMVKTPEGKQWAQQVFEKAKAAYHPLAVQTVGALLK
ncbi:MAG: M1 family metallopeptidase [Bacteroidota bacterium]